MRYDSNTIRDIQRRVGAPADGILGPDTIDALVRWRERHPGEMTYAEFLERWEQALPSSSLDDVFAGEERALGIDVSHHQGEIDWDKVAASRVSFVFLKATEGRTFTDTRFQSNRERIERTDLLMGAYHYCHLVNGEGNGQHRTEPVQGAEHFLSTLGDTLPDLPLVIDLETHRVEALTALEGATSSADWISAFVDTLVNKTGQLPVLYWSRRIFKPERLGKETTRFHHLPTWWARYIPSSSWSTLPPTAPDHPSGWGWNFWQFTSSGEVPGIAGPVDLDLCFLPPEDMAVWSKRRAG